MPTPGRRADARVPDSDAAPASALRAPREVIVLFAEGQRGHRVVGEAEPGGVREMPAVELDRRGRQLLQLLVLGEMGAHTEPSGFGRRARGHRALGE